MILWQYFNCSRILHQNFVPHVSSWLLLLFYHCHHCTLDCIIFPHRMAHVACINGHLSHLLLMMPSLYLSFFLFKCQKLLLLSWLNDDLINKCCLFYCNNTQCMRKQLQGNAKIKQKNTYFSSFQIAIIPKKSWDVIQYGCSTVFNISICQSFILSKNFSKILNGFIDDLAFYAIIKTPQNSRKNLQNHK